ncbi:transposable element Tcb1 transposase [Trichonephila clavipes]|nr:transposable element Tcb1 transposase [Trichonephila clavipes]
MTVTDCSATSRTIAQNIEIVTHHSVSARIIRRHLQQSGLSARRLLLDHDGQIRVWRHRGERMLNSCIMHRHSGPEPGIMGLATAIFQQDKERLDVARIVQRFFVNFQIELLPWPARCPDPSPIENMWCMIAEQLTQITLRAATPDPLWQRVEALWSAVPQEQTQSLFESIPRLVAAVISNIGIHSGY